MLLPTTTTTSTPYSTADGKNSVYNSTTLRTCRPDATLLHHELSIGAVLFGFLLNLLCVYLHRNSQHLSGGAK